MNLFKKFFSKKENSDEDVDFASSELRKEKNTDFHDKKNESQDSFSEKQQQHQKKDNDINSETVKNILKTVADSLEPGSREQIIINNKLNENNFKNIHMVKKSSVIIKNGKQVYKSDKTDDKTAASLNELFNEIFDK